MQVFNDEWHKLHFGVFRDRVVLYVNCQPVGEQPLQPVNSRIDLNGDILIAKVGNWWLWFFFRVMFLVYTAIK